MKNIRSYKHPLNRKEYMEKPFSETSIPVGNVITGQAQPQYVVQNPIGAGVGIVPQTNAVLALILACLSWVTCGICMSLPALLIANSALNITKQVPGHPDQGNANAAYWVALINIIISILVIVLYAVLIAAAVASEGY